MSEESIVECIKVVLDGGKEVLLRDMKMKYQNLALQAVGSRGKDNQLLAGALMIQELIKILIIKVNGVAPKKIELENLDAMFSYKQIKQLQTVVGKMMGDENDVGEVQTEFVTIGGN